MDIEIRGLEIGAAWWRSWITSLNEFDSIKFKSLDEPIECIESHKDTTGFVESSIWFR